MAADTNCVSCVSAKSIAMGKKSIAYQPARIVSGRTRWYLVWYAPHPSSEWYRYRETFNLNRIHNLREREKRAEQLRRSINYWLERGKPAWEYSEHSCRQLQNEENGAPLANVSVTQAVEHARDLRMQANKPDTARSYRSVANMFLRYVQARGWLGLSVAEITKTHAGAYMDHCLLERKVSATTYNNNLKYLRAMWNTLGERGYAEANPFRDIRPMKKRPKKRRNFSAEEARVVLQRVRAESELLFLAILLQYCCYLRPKEIIHLKGKHFDLAAGMVEVTSDAAKTEREKHVTIPGNFSSYFLASCIPQVAPDNYVFGEGLQPNKRKRCGKGSLYRKHRTVLERL